MNVGKCNRWDKCVKAVFGLIAGVKYIFFLNSVVIQVINIKKWPSHYETAIKKLYV